ncbi:MAG TPA: hypothetical protein VKW77_03850, partial [Acidimicrobiales bacterium]|nr:hypothetical protein [Acidimicrobiales bacterium]
MDFLLSQRNLGKLSGIRGTVEELARFDPEHQTALQVAAGNRFQGLVVESDQVAEECIKLLRSEKRGRATFLPLNRMLPGRPHGKSLVAAQSTGAVGFAIDLVKFDEELRPAFWYVFGETVVMKDLASARAQMGGVRLATLTGDLIEATGAMTGGYLETGGRGTDSAVQLKRLGEELREKSGAEAAAKAELARLSDEVRKLTEELAKRTGEAQAHTSARGLIEQELASARQRLAESAKRIQQAKSVHAKAEEALAKATRRAQELSDSLAATKESLQTLNEQFYGHLPSALSNKMRALQEAAQAAAEARLTATRELEAAKGALLAARQAATARAQELEGLRAQRVEKEKALVELKASVTAAREALEALKTVEAQQMKAVEGQAEKRRQLEAKRVGIVD